VIVCIGLLELSSIAMGYEAEDAMLKASAVDLVLARTICSGKFLVIVSGDVDAVKSSVTAGKQVGSGYVVDELVLPSIHPDIFPALGGSVVLEACDRGALGIVETFSAASTIKGADAACKAADGILFTVHLAMAIGGKGYFCFTGDVASVNTAVHAAMDVIREDGLLAGKSIIPNPSGELFRDLL
jgi:bacterial microcompartment shell protein